jgi:type IV secretion system protein VirB11
MLRTTHGPAIAAFLEYPSIVEVMLIPDCRLWIDQLSGGLEDSRRTMSAPRSTRSGRASPPSYQRRGNGSNGCCRPSSRPRPLPSASRAVAVFTLDDYVAAGIVSVQQAGSLRSVVASRKNIVVAGAPARAKRRSRTRSWPGSLARAIRVVLIEDRFGRSP